MNPFNPHLGLSTQMVLLAQAAEEAKAREPDEQLQREYDAKRRLDALTAAGFEEPEKLLERLRDLSERVRVTLDDLVRTLVKLKAAPERTEELRQTIDGQSLLVGETWPCHHDPMHPMPLAQSPEAYITPFAVISTGRWDDLLKMSGPPPTRSKNKRGQRSQQKPWHPKFRRLS